MEIQNYQNYLIYPDGKVFSKKSNRFLKATANVRSKYHYIKLTRKSPNMSIHRLVAQHYIPNPDNLPQVDHINRNRQDNRICNLRWVDSFTNQQNTKLNKRNQLRLKNIHYCKRDKLYYYKKKYLGKPYTKSFKTKTEAICYKYIFILRIRAGHFN